MKPIAITGASGKLGGSIATRLAARGLSQRLIVRSPSRAPRLDGAEIAVATYLDHDAMVAALEGVKTAFFVSGFEAADRVTQHKAAIEAFIAAGVERVVYTSFLGASPEATFTLARQHAETEADLQASGLRYVALRDSFYAELMPDLVVDGVLRGPGGGGRLAPVSREDVAAVAAELLLDDERPSGHLNLTGPELHDLAEIAAIVGEVRGEATTYVDETLDEARASRAHIDAPAFEIEGWISSYRAIAAGDFAVLSDAVERITGRPPRSLRAALKPSAG